MGGGEFAERVEDRDGHDQSGGDDGAERNDRAGGEPHHEFERIGWCVPLDGATRARSPA